MDLSEEQQKIIRRREQKRKCYKAHKEAYAKKSLECYHKRMSKIKDDPDYVKPKIGRPLINI